MAYFCRNTGLMVLEKGGFLKMRSTRVAQRKKAYRFYLQAFVFMVGPQGFEPRTKGL